MTQINWQYQVNNRAGGYIVTATDWNDLAGDLRAFIDQTTSSTTDNSPLPIGIDLANDRVYISDPDSATPEDANHANTTLSVVGSSTFNGTLDLTSAVIQGGSPFVFEGATDNGYETTFAVTDPTADRTITFKDGTGTVAFTSDITTTSPAGSDHQVQFNDGGSFGADSNFTYDGSAMAIKVPITIGVDDTGHDFTAYGATAGSYIYWKQSENCFHISQQETSTTLTDFTQALTKASLNLIGDYSAGAYMGAILWSTDDDNATKPKAGIFHETTGSGSDLIFGTSNTYATGITATMVLKATGAVELETEVTANGVTDTILTLKNPDTDASANLTAGNGLAIDFWVPSDASGAGGAELGAKLQVNKAHDTDDSNGADFQFWTAVNGSSPTKAFTIEDDNDVVQWANASTECYAFQVSDGGTCALYMDNDDGAKGTSGGWVYTSANHLFSRTGGAYQWYINSSGTLRPYGTNDDLMYLSNSGSGSTSSVTPALGFVDDTDAGFYLYSAGNIAVCTAGSRRAQFSSAGFYAIKSTISTGFTYATWNSSTGYLSSTSSSQRYKENIQNMPKSEWEKVYQLQARSFDWKDDGTVELSHLGKSDFGLIAEEVNGVIPTLTGWAKEDYDDSSSALRIESVQYDKITTYLVEAVKDLNSRIKTLETA